MRHYISTGDSVLVETSPYDAIWGIRLAASSPEAQDPMKWRGGKHPGVWRVGGGGGGARGSQN